MAQLLAEMAKLSAEEQDAIAQIILETLEDERLWDDAFAESQDQSARLAERVRQDIREGRVHEKGFDEL